MLFRIIIATRLAAVVYFSNNFFAVYKMRQRTLRNENLPKLDVVGEMDMLNLQPSEKTQLSVP